MEYRALDGMKFSANSYRDLAEQLWESQFIPPPSMEEWMKGSARRAKMWDGSELRTDTPEHHIEDMIAAGLLEVLE